MKAIKDFRRLLLSGEAQTDDWLYLKHAVSKINNLPTHLKLYISVKQIEATSLKKVTLSFLITVVAQGLTFYFFWQMATNVFGVDPKGISMTGSTIVYQDFLVVL